MIQLEDVLEGAPFDSPESRRASNLFRPDGKTLASVSRPDGPPDLTATAVDGAFRAFVGDSRFTCAGAKAAVNAGSYRLGVYDDLAGDAATAGLARDLWAYTQEWPTLTAPFATFVAVFRRDAGDEAAFEKLLWRQLQRLHDCDAADGWAPQVSADPDDAHFAWSFAGCPYFVVGLHPAASRLSRRFAFPTLVFNSHEQFERLRADGKYQTMRDTIRRREKELQGDINPVLRDFGDDSAARQYSGRAVEDDWHAPFRAKGDAGKCPFHKMMSAVKGRRSTS